MRYAIAIAALLLLSGCASYEFDLIHPPQHASHIGEDLDRLVTIDPLEYRMRTVENRLVMRIYNTTDEPIQLRGDQSVVVEPEGESHPLRGQTIAPGSFLKLIFPPIRPRVYDSDPNFGVGFGVGVGGYHHQHHHRPHYHSNSYYDPFW